MYEPTSTETDCEGHPSAGYSKRTPFLCKLLSVLVHFNNYGIWFAVCRQSMIVKAFQQKHLSFTRTFLEMKQLEQVCEKNTVRCEVKALYFFARQLQVISSLDKNLHHY